MKIEAHVNAAYKGFISILQKGIKAELEAFPNVKNVTFDSDASNVNIVNVLVSFQYLGAAVTVKLTGCCYVGIGKNR